MEVNTQYDVIIVGGSYAGLSAAMALGRSLRDVLIIDSGKPCNRQTPHSHNFITQDGNTPKQITEEARRQVLAYDTVSFHTGTAVTGRKTDSGFEIVTEAGEIFTSQKLLFATGVFDIMPAIDGFAACWGITVLHCPYCHGYEVKHEPLGVFGNGDMGFEFSKLISNWSKDLTLFTNGKATLTEEQLEKLKSKNIRIVETEIAALEHSNGILHHVVLQDGTKQKLTAVYARVPNEQHCKIPATLGCELTEQGLITTDEFQRTGIPGVYAAGDNTTPMRAVAAATAAGMLAGACINKELIDENF